MPASSPPPSSTLSPAFSSSPSSSRPSGRSGQRRPGARRPAAGALSAPLRVQEAPSAGAFDRAGDFRIEADLVQLNLSFLHVARELARSARELAITRLGLDAAACAALCRLSVADLQALAHSHALIFGLRVDPADLSLQAQLARTNPTASDARVLLSEQRG